VRWQSRLNKWESAALDRRLSIDSAGVIEPTTLTVPDGDATAGFTYVGTPPRLARWWLAAVPEDAAEFTFIDMGSGKGRMLVLAAQHGFGRVLGVEFAQELHEIALENMRTLRGRGIAIEPILGDAGAFVFPEEPLVVHFNNPFHESVMERVVANLVTSYEQTPRPILVIYQQMTVEPPWQQTGNIALLDRVPFLVGRTLTAPRWPIDRSVLRAFTVRVYESAEIARNRA
jgi:hypothetical protein